jgi:hypothetical protein
MLEDNIPLEIPNTIIQKPKIINKDTIGSKSKGLEIFLIKKMSSSQWEATTSSKCSRQWLNSRVLKSTKSTS